MIDDEIESVRTARAAVIDAALRRLMSDLQVFVAREVDLQARREKAVAPASAELSPSETEQPFETLVPQRDATGRDPRGANVIVRELVTRAGPRGMYQRDLDSQAYKFGFSRGAVARAKQRLREEGIGTFDTRWRVWRLLKAEERSEWEREQPAAGQAA